jgi:hypothetical protein
MWRRLSRFGREESPLARFLNDLEQLIGMLISGIWGIQHDADVSVNRSSLTPMQHLGQCLDVFGDLA